LGKPDSISDGSRTKENKQETTRRGGKAASREPYSRVKFSCRGKKRKERGKGGQAPKAKKKKRKDKES